MVTLHCPLTPETTGLINASRLASMKPTAFLINTGRGPLVVEADLAEALNAGRIAGAGLDVLSAEPPPADNPLLRAKNCIITPHIALGHPRIAGATDGCRRRQCARLPCRPSAERRERLSNSPDSDDAADVDEMKLAALIRVRGVDADRSVHRG